MEYLIPIAMFLLVMFVVWRASKTASEEVYGGEDLEEDDQYDYEVARRYLRMYFGGLMRRIIERIKIK